MYIKDTKKFFFTTEGETEELYLKRLQKLINSSNKAKCKVCFLIIKEKDPQKSIKKFTSPLDDVTIYHFFDFESNNANDSKKFKNILNKMLKAEKMGKEVNFFPCYSNLAFELWIILHKKDSFGEKTNVKDYLKEINDIFERFRKEKCQGLKEYKREENFKAILEEIKIEDVKEAVSRAEEITKIKERDQEKKKESDKYSYYENNPYTEAGKVIGNILRECGIIT